MTELDAAGNKIKEYSDSGNGLTKIRTFTYDATGSLTDASFDREGDGQIDERYSYTYETSDSDDGSNGDDGANASLTEGTIKDDRLTGTNKSDTINGKGGNDTLTGLKGKLNERQPSAIWWVRHWRSFFF